MNSLTKHKKKEDEEKNVSYTKQKKNQLLNCWFFLLNYWFYFNSQICLCGDLNWLCDELCVCMYMRLCVGVWGRESFVSKLWIIAENVQLIYFIFIIFLIIFVFLFSFILITNKTRNLFEHIYLHLLLVLERASFFVSIAFFLNLYCFVSFLFSFKNKINYSPISVNCSFSTSFVYIVFLTIHFVCLLWNHFFLCVSIISFVYIYWTPAHF